MNKISMLIVLLIGSTTVSAHDFYYGEPQFRPHHWHHRHHRGEYIYAPPPPVYYAPPPVRYAPPPPPVYYYPPQPPVRYYPEHRGRYYPQSATPQGLAGGVVGSVIGYGVSNGDPLVTGLGAAAGAFIGNQ